MPDAWHRWTPSASAAPSLSLLDGAWLKDLGVANAELHPGWARRPARLFPVYALNPVFPAWPEHLDRCIRKPTAWRREPGRCASSPPTTATASDHPALDACLYRLQALGLPAVLTWQLEDARMQGAAMRAPDLSPAGWAPRAARHPALRLTITGAVQGPGALDGRPPGAPPKPGCGSTCPGCRGRWTRCSACAGRSGRSACCSEPTCPCTSPPGAGAGGGRCRRGPG